MCKKKTNNNRLPMIAIALVTLRLKMKNIKILSADKNLNVIMI